jgi:hypothetical protein
MEGSAEMIFKTSEESFEHIPEAVRLFEHGQQRRYRVETINWSLAIDHDTGMLLGIHRHYLDPDLAIREDELPLIEVHRNVYRLTLEELVDFIRNTADVAEDVISITIEGNESLCSANAAAFPAPRSPAK